MMIPLDMTTNGNITGGIRSMIKWGSKAKRRRDHLHSKEDALARQYEAAYDRKHKRVLKWRWDAGVIKKIRLPAHTASDEQEQAHWSEVVKYWKMVRRELLIGGFPKGIVHGQDDEQRRTYATLRKHSTTVSAKPGRTGSLHRNRGAVLEVDTR